MHVYTLRWPWGLVLYWPSLSISINDFRLTCTSTGSMIHILEYVWPLTDLPRSCERFSSWRFEHSSGGVRLEGCPLWRLQPVRFGRVIMDQVYTVRLSNYWNFFLDMTFLWYDKYWLIRHESTIFFYTTKLCRKVNCYFYYLLNLYYSYHNLLHYWDNHLTPCPRCDGDQIAVGACGSGKDPRCNSNSWSSIILAPSNPEGDNRIMGRLVLFK